MANGCARNATQSQPLKTQNDRNGFERRLKEFAQLPAAVKSDSEIGFDRARSKSTRIAYVRRSKTESSDAGKCVCFSRKL